MGRKSPDINFRHPRKLWVCYMLDNNLLEQVLAIYRHHFVDTTNELRQTCRADEYFDISIGKTPPRKEPQWFSTNPKDVTWVSISDMGTCGLYISESSEQLTREAIDRHNVMLILSPLKSSSRLNLQ